MKNFIKQFSIFEIGLAFTILIIHIYAATADAYTFPNFWFKRDDAYYYFKVAQNITEGFGSSFDGINLTNGYHPLWMIICIPIFALARFDVILPLRVLLIVIACMQIVTAILLYRMIKKYMSHAVAILAASFWSFNFYIHGTVYQMGLETPLAALSIVFLIYKLSEFEETWRKESISLKQIAWLGLLSAAMMFSRLDLVFLAVIFGIWILFRGSPIRYLLPFDLLIIFISMTSAVILRTGFDPYNTLYASSAVEATVLASIIKTLSLYFWGAYQHPRTKSIWKNLLNVFYGTTIGSVITASIYLLLLEFGIGENFPRSAFLIDLGISLILFSTLRLSLYLFSARNLNHSDNAPLVQLQSNLKKWFNEGFVYYGVLGVLLIVYMTFNHFMFGTSSPVSGQIKRWWGTLPNSAYDQPASNWHAYFGTGVSGLDAWEPFTSIFSKLSKVLLPFIRGSTLGDERFYITVFFFILLGFILLYAQKHKSLRVITYTGLIPLATGSGIQLLSYTATAYGGAKEWYWASQLILLTLVFSLLIHIILKPLQKIKSTKLILETVFCIIGLYFAYQLWLPVQKIMVHNFFPANKPYMEVVDYLEKNTLPGSVIGMTGGGNVGYFIKDRTIVNMDGLINSYEYFRALQNGQAPIYLKENETIIIFANPRLLLIPPYYGQFAPYLVRYSNYGGKDLLYLLKEPKY